MHYLLYILLVDDIVLYNYNKEQDETYTYFWIILASSIIRTEFL